MKIKKYNTSLKQLYDNNNTVSEATTRLTGGGMKNYSGPSGKRCKIIIPDGVRDWFFKIRGKNPDHTKAVAVIANKLPTGIFKGIESAISNKENFDSLFGTDGVVSDIAGLALTAVECRLFNVAMKELEFWIGKFEEMTTGNKQATGKEKTGMLGLAGVLADNQSIFNLKKEEEGKLNYIAKMNRVDLLVLSNILKKFDTSRIRTDKSFLLFENFLVEYYNTKKWDKNKLFEDIDTILGKVEKIKNIRNESITQIYNQTMKILGAPSNRENIEILENIEYSNSKEVGQKFKQKLLNMIFNPNYRAADSSFYSSQIATILINSVLKNSFDAADNKIHPIIGQFAQELISKLS